MWCVGGGFCGRVLWFLDRSARCEVKGEWEIMTDGMPDYCYKKERWLDSGIN